MPYQNYNTIGNKNSIFDINLNKKHQSNENIESNLPILF